MTTRAANSRWQTLESLFSAGSLGALTDVDLLDRFRNDRGADGQNAFRALIERHGPMVLGLCRRVVPDAHEAEDAFQATFLVLVRKGHTIRIGDSVGPWLYGVASRVARRARRRSNQRQARQVPLEDDVAKAVGTTGPECETEHVIYQEIDRLPARLRAPIVLCTLQGLSYDAAARQLGLTEPALRGRLHRARRRLKSRLHRRGIAVGLALPLLEPVSQHGGAPAVPSALVRATLQHATWWSSVSGLVAGESAIPATIAALARSVLRSMFLNSCKALGITALLAAWAVGTVVWAGQRPVTPKTIVSPQAPAQAQSKNRDRPAQKAGLEKVLPQFRTLVGAQDETFSKLQSLKCVIDLLGSEDGGRTWTNLETYKLWKSGPWERMHQSRHRLQNPGGGFEVIKPPQGERDALFAPDGVPWMDRYDSTNPPREPVTMLDELTSKNTIDCRTAPAQAFAPGGYKTWLAADYLLLTLVDIHYSLHDLCEAEINAGSKPTQRRDAQGNVLWDIALKAPLGQPPWNVHHDREYPDGKFYSFVVTLSPRHGYSIIESERLTRVEKGPGQPVLEVRDRNQVLEFQEPAPGVFLARRIRETRTRSDAKDNPTFLGEIIIHDVEANGPITEKDLAFRFPKGIGVMDMEKKVIFIWGDGAPASTLTIDQYDEMRRQQRKHPGFIDK